MVSNIEIVIAAVGGTFTLLNALMGLLDQIDDRIKIILGVSEPGGNLSKEIRLFILNRDVKSRWLAMMFLMISTGSIFVFFALTSPCLCKTTNYLIWICLGIGVGCLLGSVVTLVYGKSGIM
ncbi:hypothetical protein [Methylomonas sp. UP202]|uniref:hypothetical protein n=1 Tax=Methylomonas sp. UP202 TaxID=3040943 RepID=UPI00247874C8|nr:hypothetical protein [Methylomonas sp. UP202]WGS85037.1 hypothetical protein QC632_18575 [Methylomonas sp. UP202]